MPKQYINPPTLFSSLPYSFSQSVVTRGMTTIYISGQVALDVQKQIVGGYDLEAQTRKALSNLRAAVEAASGACQTWWHSDFTWSTTGRGCGSDLHGVAGILS